MRACGQKVVGLELVGILIVSIVSALIVVVSFKVQNGEMLRRKLRTLP